MSRLNRVGSLLTVGTIAVITTFGAEARAQMVAPNPYATVQGIWGKLPDGRTWGATSAVYPAAEHAKPQASLLPRANQRPS